MGRAPHLRLSRRRDQRHHRRDRPPRRRHRLHPGAPRGAGGVHGVRAREVHRRAGRVPGHVGPGRDPSAQRPLRREERSYARARDHGPVGDDRDGQRVPARSRPAEPLQRRRERVRRHADEPGAGAACDRPRGARRAVRAHGHRADLPQGPPGRKSGRAPAAHDELQRVEHRHRAGAHDPAAGRSPARRRRAQRRFEGRHPRRRRRVRRRGRADRGRRPAAGGLRESAARQSGAARRSAVGHGNAGPARHEGVERHDERVRHAADGRHELSLRAVLAQGRQSARRADRHQRRAAGHPLSHRGELAGFGARHARGAAAAAAAEDRYGVA